MTWNKKLVLVGTLSEARRAELCERLRTLGSNAERHPAYKGALKLLNNIYRKEKLAQRLAVLQRERAALVTLGIHGRQQDDGHDGDGHARSIAKQDWLGSDLRRAPRLETQQEQAARDDHGRAGQGAPSRHH